MNHTGTTEVFGSRSANIHQPVNQINSICNAQNFSIEHSIGLVIMCHVLDGLSLSGRFGQNVQISLREDSSSEEQLSAPASSQGKHVLKGLGVGFLL